MWDRLRDEIFETVSRESAEIAAEGLDRGALAFLIYNWLSRETPKRAWIIATKQWVTVVDSESYGRLDSTDLPSKLGMMKARIESFSKTASVTVVKGALKVIPAPEHVDLMNELSNGTSWFAGHHNLASYLAQRL